MLRKVPYAAPLIKEEFLHILQTKVHHWHGESRTTRARYRPILAIGPNVGSLSLMSKYYGCQDPHIFFAPPEVPSNLDTALRFGPGETSLRFTNN